MPTRESSRTTAQDWEREWRQGVTETLQNAMQQAQQTAVLVEKLTMRVDSLEKAPKEARAWFNSANQAVGTVITIGAMLVTVLVTLLGHISLH